MIEPATRRANHFVLSEVTLSNVKTSREKYMSSVFRKNMICIAHPGSAKRGGRVVTDVEAGSDGRFWLRLTSASRGGRQNRVVPIPRRWDQPFGFKNFG